MNTVKPEQVGCSSERLKRIGMVMQRYINEGKIAGILAMVVRRGQMVYSKCFGMMDIEANKPMQFDTLFRIYSMTKPITSVAVMMLYEEGHFQLTDPVSRFIPGFEDAQVLVNVTESGLELANLEREITIWHLLTHTSGLSYGFDENDPVDKRAYGSGEGGSQSEQIIKPTVHPSQTQVKQMIEAILTPAHAHTFEALLNQPLAGAFHNATANRKP